VPPKTASKETVDLDRSRRRTVTGVVSGDKMDKTIKVRVDRFVQHPMFEKTLKKSYVVYAHDEKREARTGDKVELMETRPLSKLKTWRLLAVLQKAAGGAEDARAASRPAAKPADKAPKA
jgi:small subunit ribosomal protein S17